MLLPRLITAFVLIPATLAILYYASVLVFLIITTVIVLYGAWEWVAMMQVSSRNAKIIYLILMALALLAVSALTPAIILFSAIVFWLIAFILVLAYPRLSNIWGRGVILRGLMGLLVLVPFWWSLNFIRSGAHWFAALIFVLVLIWGADSGAYFTGRKWGKHKLAPQVSPGKSWEGCAGAALTTLIIAIITFAICKLPLAMWPAGIALSFITIFFSIIGDLLESMIKRQAGVKDSGTLLPGHGGLLDRIDSLTAAIPVYVFCVWVYMQYLK